MVVVHAGAREGISGGKKGRVEGSSRAMLAIAFVLLKSAAAILAAAMFAGDRRTASSWLAGCVADLVVRAGPLEAGCRPQPSRCRIVLRLRRSHRRASHCQVHWCVYTNTDPPTQNFPLRPDPTRLKPFDQR